MERIMATPRLTENEVHAACVEIAAQGERPSSLALLRRLGRGSLTTITKHLNSWNSTNQAQSVDASALPVTVQLPEELAKAGEDGLKKLWSMAKNEADKELEIQREALRQAELQNQVKVEEAFQFSEAQTLTIEGLEEKLAVIKTELSQEKAQHKQTLIQLNAAEKNNVGLTRDNEYSQQAVNALKQQITTLNAARTAAEQATSAAEKQGAQLEGQLLVYQTRNS